MGTVNELCVSSLQAFMCLPVTILAPGKTRRNREGRGSKLTVCFHCHVCIKAYSVLTTVPLNTIMSQLMWVIFVLGCFGFIL